MLRERDEDDEDDEYDEDDDEDYNPLSSKPKKATPPSYANLISTIGKIFTDDFYKDYSIDKDPKKLDPETSNGYVFYIREKTNSTNVVSTIVIYVRNSEEKVTPTRKSPSKEITVFHISSLSTNVEHGNKSLAILLFIYAISYLKLYGYSAVEYSTLDDCSNRSTKLDGNIYHILGYVPIDETCLKEQECQACSLAGPFDIDGHPLDLELKLSGPEKIADLKVFPQRANDKLDMIIRNNGIKIGRPKRNKDSRKDGNSRRGGGKKFTRKSHKRKSHKRKSHKRKSHKRKSHKRKSHKRK